MAVPPTVSALGSLGTARGTTRTPAAARRPALALGDPYLRALLCARSCAPPRGRTTPRFGPDVHLLVAALRLTRSESAPRSTLKMERSSKL